MTTGRWVAAAFCVVCVVQLALPARTIVDHERRLADGQVHRVLVEAVDPVDPLRGRYVRLRMPNLRADMPWPRLEEGDVTWVELVQDDDGYAVAGRVATEPPPWPGAARLEVSRASGNSVFWTLPFDRFYLTEARAPAAEAAYRDAVRDGDADVWVTVRVLDGEMTLEQLWIEGVPIAEHVEQD